MEFKPNKKQKTTYLYRHFNSDNKLLYVGISLNSINRLNQHKSSSGWFDEISNVTIEKHQSRKEALIAERSAIYNESPKYNIQRPDDTASNHVERSKNEILNRVVNFKPVYTMQEACDFLTLPKTAIKELMDKGEIGKVFMGQRLYKGKSRPIYKITGWQIIEFIEQLESGKKIK